ncbi:hypothetical protein HDU93_003058, partial [Gonapodya sp. JEL0774]
DPPPIQSSNAEPSENPSTYPDGDPETDPDSVAAFTPRRAKGRSRTSTGTLSAWGGDAEGFPSPEFPGSQSNSNSPEGQEQIVGEVFESGATVGEVLTTVHSASPHWPRASMVALGPGPPSAMPINAFSTHFPSLRWNGVGPSLPATLWLTPTSTPVQTSSLSLYYPANESLTQPSTRISFLPSSYSLSDGNSQQRAAFAGLVRPLDLFGDLPYLPDQTFLNQCVQVFIQYSHRSFNFLHIPTFFFKIRQNTLHPALYLAVVTIGSLHHPGRPGSALRNSVALRLHATIKASIVNLNVALVEALLMFSGFLMTEAGRMVIGMKWFRGTVKAAKALGINTEDASQELSWIEQEERRRIWALLFVMDTLLAAGFESTPIITKDDYQTKIPGRDSDYWKWEEPREPALDPEIVFDEEKVRSSRLFLDIPKRSPPVVEDNYNLLATSLMSIFRLRLAMKAVGDDVQTLRSIMEDRLLRWFQVLPIGVQAVALDQPTSFLFCTAFVGEQEESVPTTPHQVGHLVMREYYETELEWALLFLTTFGPKTPENYLADSEWHQSADFIRCIEVATQGTRVLECIMRSPTGLRPVAGGTINYHIFQIGMVHLVYLKTIVAKIPYAD